MKIGHISDLHLGCKIEKDERTEETKEVLEEIVKKIEDENIKILLITGDIFDSYNPSNSSLDIFYSFMKKLANITEKVYIIPGNHDNSNFIGVNRHFFEEKGIKIFYDINTGFDNLTEIVNINGKKILIQGLPYINDVKILYYILKSKGDISTVNISNYSQVYQSIISSFKSIAREKEADYKILMAHLLLEVPEIKFTSESYIFTVNKDIFKDNPYNYIALGHIHKPLKVDKLDNIYYAGSILRLNFGEKEDKKGFYIIDTDTNSVEFKEVSCYKMEEIEYKEVIKNLDDLKELIEINQAKDRTIYKFKIVYEPPLTYPEILKEIKSKYRIVKLEATLKGIETTLKDFSYENIDIVNIYKSYRKKSDDDEIIETFKKIVTEVKNENR
ncbi:MAG TPA: exonuclease SbcCD subunit D [Spirochaetota bacterium]|nr:exonuclease SbcCD subunit D [Spirochaetota bacterium]HOM38592.1 exonuclease SbcCD subunit D [Spirochaetota bacterium]HPQ49729.1 exonuclease SbcCD subunit D [Spirochaetota bacterium]